MMSSTSDLQKKINQRKAARTLTLSVIKKCRTELEKADVTHVKLLGLQNNLVSKLEQLNCLNVDVLGLIDPDDVEQDTLESMEFVEDTHELLAEITLKVQSLTVISRSETARPESVVSSNRSVTSRCRLPKFELPVFKGDPLAWQGFWDQFRTSIDENDEITDIDRFNYLKRYLGGTALETVSGLSLSSTNYKEAINVLKERYGNPQVLISAHMDRLINMNKVSNKEDIQSLRKLYNSVENCTRNLNALSLDVSSYGSLLIPLLKGKLPDDLNITIARRFGSEVWTLKRLMTYFNDELTAYENCKSLIKSSGSDEKGKKSKLESPYTTKCLYGQGNVSNSSKRQCVFCNSDGHLASKCTSVTNVRARLDIVRKQGRCFLCLGKGHLFRDCQSKYSCNKCKRRHHVSICTGEAQSDNIAHATFASVEKSVLMQTASAKIANIFNERQSDTRILFDSGSDRSYISQELCDRLRLTPVRSEPLLINTFGTNEAKRQTLNIYRFKVLNKDSNGFNVVEAYGVPVVCSPLTRQNIGFVKRNCPHVQGLVLADSSVKGERLHVDVLIGLDFYHDFFKGNSRRGNGGPVASETTLGWVLSGRFELPNDQPTLCLQTHAVKVQVEKDFDLRGELGKFWEIESVGEQEKSVIDDFENHIFHDGSRYVTKLPFKPDHDPLSDNFNVSQRRLKSNVRKLKSSGIYDDYHEVLKEYESEKIIERVPPDEVYKESGTVHYLPHRAVVKEDRITTKIRPVFDASCKINGPSLNECLYSGPNLLSKIFDILFRFRLNKIGIVADIRKAFLNISIAPEHRDFLRFIWEENDEQVIFRFRRLVMGLTCSPFLLNGTIRQHLQKEIGKYPAEVLKRLGEDLYVDDITSGCESVEEGKRFQKAANGVMKDAGLDLRKWMTNDEGLQRFFDGGKVSGETKVDDVTFAKSVTGTTVENGHHKVLGLEWDRDSDELLFEFKDLIKKSKDGVLTKRKILSLSVTMYDPLGIISPVTAQLKTLFQLLCVDKASWDEVVSDDIENKWRVLMERIGEFGVIRIPRYALIDRNEIVSVELHGFSDSSLILYCGVVYLRVITKSHAKAFFWTSKTRVAPLKKISIPRLELLGGLLLTKLISNVNVALCERLKIDRVVCWSDSTVTLCWIRGKEKTWKAWVENRVVKIRKVVPRESWFHVAGTENPADAPTRPIEDFSALFQDKWLSGPSFLSESDIDYNKGRDNETELPIDAQEELRRTDAKVMTVTLDMKGSLSNVIEFSRYGSLRKLVNVVAYVLRFKNNLLSKKNKCQKTDNELTTDEATHALSLIIRDEQYRMATQSNFEKTQPNLNVFQDAEGLYRIKSRFKESSLPTKKYPLLMPEATHLTKLLIRDAHENVLHFGVESTLAKLREVYWIIRGRKAVKNTLHKCVICRRFQGRTLKPPETPNLPEFRVNYDSAPFSSTGLDFAGPLYVKNKGLASSKVYILLFTCASSRAIHLELTPDMKSPAFIRGFQRFASRRGTPIQIINDNAKTFKSKEVKRLMSHLNVHQQFILPASPWWGGFYERLVRSVKTSLKKILKKALLTFEELQTVLTEIEAVINQRPLCYMSDDEIGNTITPNHLIFGRQLSSKPSVNVFSAITSVDDCTRRVKYILNLVQHFQKRFRVTYLNELKQKHMYNKTKTSAEQKLTLNDVVLIKDDSPQPRTQWRIGKVEKLVIGADGKIRGARLKVNTSNGTSLVHRPVQKIIPFEIANDDTSLTNIEEATSSGGARGDEHKVGGRMRRRAAIEGQNLRRAREFEK